MSNLCCDYLKKKPSKIYGKESNRKAITGVMGNESVLRSTRYKSCFSNDGSFHPLWDLTGNLQQEIEREFNIPVPDVYHYTNQTGCAGCPYGQHGKNCFENTNIDLTLCGEGQRKFILEYFAESYKFKGYYFQPMLFI